MKLSRLLAPTLKETPAEAEIVSHQLLLRAGLIRKLASGVYTWLPLGLRVLRKVERIVRQAMDNAGAQEILMPGVQPADLWEESGRWEHYGKELLRFKDRHDHAYCLAPTHEEVITDLVRREIRSYRDMPLNLYQIQTKFRDEVRPRFGLMRAREFLMKDAYSFDTNEDTSAVSYQIMRQAYMDIFDRLGLKYSVVEADSGSIGGSFSHEFMVLAGAGEDAIVSCESCDFAANVEKAEVKLTNEDCCEPKADTEKVDTPNAHTIEEVAGFLNVKADQTAKTMIYLADGNPIAAIVRGDREVNEIKLKNLVEAAELDLASPDVIQEVTGGPMGFSGPIGLEIPIYADQELYLIDALVVGANEKDAHIKNAHIQRDAPKAIKADLRDIAQTDVCPRCGSSISFARGIEVGHIFRLGTKYSEALKATYLDSESKAQPIVMGCYGIGVSRIVAAAIEQSHDENGIIFPYSIAPYSVAILPMKIKGEAMEAAQAIYDDLWAKGVDVVMDDRDVRPGFKFKDNDLQGIPLRVVIGPKGLKNGEVELKIRATGEVKMLSLDTASETICEMVKQGGGQSL